MKYDEICKVFINLIPRSKSHKYIFEVYRAHFIRLLI